MADQITISKTLGIRNCGYDEDWLKEQIAAKPSVLGLGDLMFVEREKRQLSGGRLDIVLKTRDGDTVFDVEVMLGETDGSHISRTIEYWDLEQSQDSKREHFPVLVAEDVTRRFFNVIYRISHSIPIIAIKANIVEVEGKKALHFTTILNAFENLEFEGRAQSETAKEVVNENFWENSSVLASAKALQEILSPMLAGLKIGFTKSKIRLRYCGEIYFSLSQKRGDKSVFFTWLENQDVSAVIALLKAKSIDYKAKPYDTEKWQTIGFDVDENFIRGNAEFFQKIGKLVDQSWQRYWKND